MTAKIQIPNCPICGHDQEALTPEELADIGGGLACDVCSTIIYPDGTINVSGTDERWLSLSQFEKGRDMVRSAARATLDKIEQGKPGYLWIAATRPDVYDMLKKIAGSKP